MTLTIVDEQAISFPWIELVKNAYSMRVRVNNFSAVGKRSFTRILSKAVGGVNSYFLMQDGDPLSTCLLYTSGRGPDAVVQTCWFLVQAVAAQLPSRSA